MRADIIIGQGFWASIDGPSSAQADAEEALSYRPKGFQFSPSYKSGAWNGWSTLWSKRHNGFPAGLADYVEKALAVEGFEVEVIDQRRPPEPTVSVFHQQTDVTLEEHQSEAVETALERGRGLVHHAVGAGKSLVLLETVRRLSVPSLALVHTKDLLWQLAKNGQKYLGCEVGIIGDGRWKRGAFTVATFQSIYQRLKAIETQQEMQALLDGFDAVLVDECQHIQAKTFETVLRCLNAYYRYGYSATVFKSGDKETMLRVQAWIGPVISRLDSKGGIKAGRLVPADVLMVGTGNLEPVDTDYMSAYQSGVVKNGGRNGLIVAFAQKLRKRGPVLILVERLEHGIRLARELQCTFLQGNVSGAERDRNWEAMRRGQVDCMVASVIADEGVDVPNVSALILAGGGKAPHKIIQRIGRGQRRVAGKSRLFVIDFSDRGTYLGRHAKKRQQLYEREPAYSLELMTKDEAEAMLGPTG